MFCHWYQVSDADYDDDEVDFMDGDDDDKDDDSILVVIMIRTMMPILAAVVGMVTARINFDWKQSHKI